MRQNNADMLTPMHFTARNDYAFKKLFGTEENKDIMSEFISVVTGISKRDFRNLEIHFLDLTKVSGDNLTAVEKWLMFIKTESKEVRAMLAQDNPLLAKANQVMDSFYLNDKERALYRAACKYESDRISMINEAERKGIVKGIEQGIEQGYADGAYYKAIETANLMKQANCERAFIAKMTGLTIQEIEAL